MLPPIDSRDDNVPQPLIDEEGRGPMVQYGGKDKIVGLNSIEPKGKKLPEPLPGLSSASENPEMESDCPGGEEVSSLPGLVRPTIVRPKRSVIRPNVASGPSLF
jgi:hypothetical protein